MLIIRNSSKKNEHKKLLTDKYVKEGFYNTSYY